MASADSLPGPHGQAVQSGWASPTLRWANHNQGHPTLLWQGGQGGVVETTTNVQGWSGDRWSTGAAESAKSAAAWPTTGTTRPASQLEFKPGKAERLHSCTMIVLRNITHKFFRPQHLAPAQDSPDRAPASSEHNVTPTPTVYAPCLLRREGLRFWDACMPDACMPGNMGDSLPCCAGQRCLSGERQASGRLSFRLFSAAGQKAGRLTVVRHNSSLGPQIKNR